MYIKSFVLFFLSFAYAFDYGDYVYYGLIDYKGYLYRIASGDAITFHYTEDLASYDYRITSLDTNCMAISQSYAFFAKAHCSLPVSCPSPQLLQLPKDHWYSSSLGFCLSFNYTKIRPFKMIKFGANTFQSEGSYYDFYTQFSSGLCYGQMDASSFLGPMPCSCKTIYDTTSPVLKVGFHPILKDDYCVGWHDLDGACSPPVVDFAGLKREISRYLYTYVSKSRKRNAVLFDEALFQRNEYCMNIHHEAMGAFSLLSDLLLRPLMNIISVVLEKFFELLSSFIAEVVPDLKSFISKVLDIISELLPELEYFVIRLVQYVIRFLASFLKLFLDPFVIGWSSVPLIVFLATFYYVRILWFACFSVFLYFLLVTPLEG